MNLPPFVISLLAATPLAIAGAYAGFHFPLASMQIVDLMATVSSILVAISLSIIAIVASPVQANEGNGGSTQRIVDQNDAALADQQLLISAGFFVNLSASLLLKYLSFWDSEKWAALPIEIASSTFMGSMTWSLVLALYLPFLLRAIIRARRSFNK